MSDDCFDTLVMMSRSSHRYMMLNLLSLNRVRGQSSIVNEYSMSLADTNYGGADLMASKHDDGTISYCIAVDADGTDYSDNMLYCPFCGKKLKRRWK